MKSSRITSSVVLRNGIAAMNGSVFFKGEGKDVAAFSKELYKNLGTDYPKFFKMDHLCKLAFVSVELLLKGHSLESYAADEVALVFSNASASIDTDRTYYKSIEDKKNYFPSPAIFVYTLPNIMMGEICIRHKLLGENTFFISEKFDAELLAKYSQELLSTGKAKCVIAGWVEINGDEWESSLFLIESSNDESGKVHSSTVLEELYKINNV
jgi:hypothetical protein